MLVLCRCAAAVMLLPALGESVTTATVARWIKQQGEAVAADEPLVELETDKVTVEVNAPAGGVLSSIAVPEGTEVEVGSILGLLDAAGAAPAVAKPVEARPAANPPAAFDHLNRYAGALQQTRGVKTGHAGAEDQYVGRRSGTRGKCRCG